MRTLFASPYPLLLAEVAAHGLAWEARALAELRSFITYGMLPPWGHEYVQPLTGRVRPARTKRSR